MNKYIKIFMLLGFASLIVFSPLLANNADEDKKIDPKEETILVEDSTSGEFYFPAFEPSMDNFWSEAGVLSHDCSASSWLGGTASASCSEKENCTCTSTFVSVECHCSDPN